MADVLGDRSNPLWEMAVSIADYLGDEQIKGDYWSENWWERDHVGILTVLCQDDGCNPLTLEAELVKLPKVRQMLRDERRDLEIEVEALSAENRRLKMKAVS